MGASRTFDALGTQIEIDLSDDAESLLDDVEQRIRDLEALWSRFVPDSELSLLNAAGGQPVSVSPVTRQVLQLAMDAHDLTGGIFDPRVLGALEAAGYRESRATLKLDQCPATTGEVAQAQADGLRLPLAVEFDDCRSSAALPFGDRWDLGGIGKGFAADLVVDEFASARVPSLMVNLGGDIRVFGDAPGAPCWTVRVDDPFVAGCPMAEVHLTAGGVATSSRMKRRWIHDGLPRHHVIDPRTGQPAVTDLVAVTVVAGTTWWAEVLAKAALILGPTEGCRLIEEFGCSGLLVDIDSTPTVIGDHVRIGVAT